MTPAHSFQLRGDQISDLDTFYDEIEEALGSSVGWFGRNLDALDDILQGEVGQLPAAFTLVWTNSERSRIALGHGAESARLRMMLESCHPSNRPTILARMADAERREGPTLFDTLVAIIRSHENVHLIRWWRATHLHVERPSAPPTGQLLSECSGLSESSHPITSQGGGPSVGSGTGRPIQSSACSHESSSPE